jgi:hypothetical protein
MDFNLGRIALILGTILMVTLTAFVSFNFVKDSSLFAEKIVAVSVKNQNDPLNNKTSNTIVVDDYETVKYQRKVDPEEKKVVVSPKPTASPKQENVVSIEFVNYTGINKIAEDVKKSFEEKGYLVSSASANSINFMTTKIIERNEKTVGIGIELRKILRVGKLSKEFGSESRFDVTVILGDDYVRP